jgi:predicted RNase H-related nuclease YkuK (DUF458 family)
MRNWKDGDGNTIDDVALFDWINTKCSSFMATPSNYELIVGVDSHLHGHFYRFITVVCLYEKGRGGFYYYSTSEQNRREFKGTYPVRVRARMFHETTLAIELVTDIQEKTGRKPIVHIDASPPNTGELTSMFSDQLRGYVVASGFEAVLKPFSFVASGVANKHSK